MYYKSHSRCDCDFFGSRLLSRSPLTAGPWRRGVGVGCDTVTCRADDAVDLDDVWADDDDAVYLGVWRVRLERPAVDDVPLSDMFRHDVRPSADSRPASNDIIYKNFQITKILAFYLICNHVWNRNRQVRDAQKVSQLLQNFLITLYWTQNKRMRPESYQIPRNNAK